MSDKSSFYRSYDINSSPAWAFMGKISEEKRVWGGGGRERMRVSV